MHRFHSSLCGLNIRRGTQNNSGIILVRGGILALKERVVGGGTNRLNRLREFECKSFAIIRKRVLEISYSLEILCYFIALVV